MEAATLNSPPCRNFLVSPVQKSLSLPSYARAGGEGIDHRIIFAALEQKERVRRKSRIFTKEKKQNSNLFCLPIKSNNKCRETSLSSDTSCSSLEYQKPSKDKKEDAKGTVKDNKTVNGNNKPASKEIHLSEVEPKYDSATAYQQEQSPNAVFRNSTRLNEIKLTVNESETPPYQKAINHVSEDRYKGFLRVSKGLPDGIYRSGIGSSGDSMERSSRSSSDSLSRKERMVALKARVEAQREKYGAESSSEEELPRTGLRITRYNSDDVIHRTVHEVKLKSSRMERRLRRRSQDEWAIKRAARKQNISLYVSPGEDIFASYHMNEEPEIKTDFCPSPQFPDLLKKNYFSDYPGRENGARFVQARIQSIENEMKRRNSVDKTQKPTKQTGDKEYRIPLQNSESMPSQKSWELPNSDYGKPSSPRPIQSSSPTPKSPKAPTPPPRSPKSLTFVNKAFMQHQNASHMRQENRSIESKPLFEPNIRSSNKSTTEESTIDESTSLEKRKIRELMSSRRKTCSNFSFIRDSCLGDTSVENHDINHSILDQEYPLNKALNERSVDGIEYTYAENFVRRENHKTETNFSVLKNKWNEIEQKREMQFNSLESKVKSFGAKRRDQYSEHTSCHCSGSRGSHQNCLCIPKTKEYPSLFENLTKMNENKSKACCNIPIRSNPISRLSKSEANIAAVAQPKIRPYVTKMEPVIKSTAAPVNDLSIQNEVRDIKQDQKSATENLESAMEELESVYQSLKFSSDNLSQRNSLSNASDEDLRRNPVAIENRSKYSEHLKTSDCSFLAMKDSAKNLKLSETSNDFNPSFSNTSVQTLSQKPFTSDTFCIDELFNDLTRQLDFEQKLLKESRDQKYQPRSTSNAGSGLDENSHQNLNSPLESIVNIRKELYNNLYKQDEEKHFEESKSIPVSKTTVTDVAKKKHKAVRSLSVNISNLMKADSMVLEPKNSLSCDQQVREYSEIASQLDNLIHESPPIRHFACSPLENKGNKSPRDNALVYNPATSSTKNESFSQKEAPIFTRLDKMNTETQNHNSKEYEDPIKIASQLDEIIQESPPIRPYLNSPFEKHKHEKHPDNRFAAHSFEKPNGTHDKPSQSPKEIRQIRVSMDTGPSKPKRSAPENTSQSFSRLTSAICHPKPLFHTSKSPEPEAPKEVPHKSSSTMDALDEAALEDLLKSLLSDIPEKQDNDHYSVKDSVPSSPVVTLPPGQSEPVICRRNCCLNNMDACVTSNPSNSKLQLDTSCSRSQRDLNEAQRVNSTSQNNNALTKMSFIPVFTKKSDIGPNLPREIKETEIKSNLSDVPSSQIRNVLSSLSPPYRQKNIIDNEMLAARTRSHVRRHSVGFEDMTSLTYCFGRNFTNDKRFQTVSHNPNASAPILTDSAMQEHQNEAVIKTIHEKQDAVNSANHDTKLLLASNENDSIYQEKGKPLLQKFEKLKDKSFKRKSSLNRIDLIHNMPILSKDKISDQEQKNSSSDENNDSRPLHKPFQTLSKRKHSSSPVAGENVWERRVNEVPLPQESINNSSKSKMLPRFCPLKMKNRKINYTNAPHFEKLSYSAGELENITSDKANYSKACLSAHEFESRENSSVSRMFRNARNIFPHRIPSHVPKGTSFVKNLSRNCSSIAKTCDNASQETVTLANNGCQSRKDSSGEIAGSKQLENDSYSNHYDNEHCVLQQENSFAVKSSEEIELLHNIQSFAAEGTSIQTEDMQLFNSRAEAAMEDNTDKIRNLEISTISLENPEFEINEELLEYESERKPCSILRKTYFEEKKELHSILKPTPDEKLSRTPPSILKHRESSEEKETGLQSDLHSILKKSTSEDESYHSNPDIRPILKNNLSTDEDSSSGGSLRPRPILKKRTSFSEECSYACYASGELKPILKKKSLMSSEDQPKPILKTRRKSEDGRPTMEFVTGARPRAYSADMGVKSNHDIRFNNDSLNLDRKESTSQKCDQHEL